MVPDIRGNQAVPSVEARMVPLPPTVTNRGVTPTRPNVIPFRSRVVPDVRGVQVIPSDDVRIVPLHPVDTKVELPKVASSREMVAVELFLRDQVIPSGEVWMFSVTPVTAKREFPKATPKFE